MPPDFAIGFAVVILSTVSLGLLLLTIWSVFSVFSSIVLTGLLGFGLWQLIVHTATQDEPWGVRMLVIFLGSVCVSAVIENKTSPYDREEQIE